VENLNCPRPLITSAKSTIKNRRRIADTHVRVVSLSLVSLVLLSVFVYVGSSHASGLLASYRNWSQSSKPLATTKLSASRASNKPVAAYQSLAQTPTEPCAQTRHEVMDAASLHYLPGETVTVTGRGFTSACEVLMAVNVPDGTVGNQTVTTDESGNLSYSYVLGSVIGDYSVQAETTDGAISLTMTQFSSGIFVMTDKTEYKPDETVTFSGRGFAPNETISLVVHQKYPGGAPDRAFSAVADSAGAFVNTDFVVEAQDLATTMTVTAAGQSSGLMADAVFSDAAAVFVQKRTNATTAAVASSINQAYAAGPTQGNLLVALVGAFGMSPTPVSIGAPAGWSTAVNEAGTATTPAHAIFYKISVGAADNSVTATFTPTSTGTISIQEFSSILASSDPFDGSASNSGATASPSPTTGTVAPVSGSNNDLLIAGVSAESTTAQLTMLTSSATNNFVGETSITTINTPASGVLRVASQSVDRKTNPTLLANSTGLTITGSASVGGWRGQIAAFKSKSDTTTAISVSPPSPVAFGQTVTLTATVSVTANSGSGTGAVGGTATFREGASPITGCVGVPVTAGSATCDVTTLTVGAHTTLNVVYNGDGLVGNYNGSTSPNLASYTVAADATACFRSATTGNWNQPSSWQQAATCAGPFVAATSIPSSNAVGIQVRVGHIITVTAASSAAALTVDSGGTLVVGNAGTLTLANGSLDDLTVAAGGTLTVLGSISMNISASITVNGTGVVENAAGGGPGAIFANNQENVVTVGVGGQLTVRSPGNASSAQGLRLTDGDGGDQLIVNGTLALEGGSVLTEHNSSFLVSGSANVSGTGSVTVTMGSAGSPGFINSGGTMTLSDSSNLLINCSSCSGDHFTVNSGGTLDLGSSTTVTGAGQLDVSSGGTLKIGDANGITTGTGATSGNVRTSGTDTYAIGANYEYKGTAAQTTGNALPATVNNLTINNSGPADVTLNIAGTTLQVNGTLALTSGDFINTATKTLVQPASAPASTGIGDVVGKVQRGTAASPVSPLANGTAYTFGNPNNTILLASTTPAANIVVNLAKNAPTTPAFATAVTRTYTITPTGGTGLSATLKLHYLDTELGTNTEATLDLWKVVSGTWTDQTTGTYTRDSSNNWVQLAGVTGFSDWTLAGSGVVNTTTTVTSSSPANTSTYGDSVTFTATVTPGVTAGDVTFMEGGTCAAPGTVLSGPTTVNGSGQASFNTSTLTVPSHTITACYAGTSGFNPSEGSVTQTVNPKAATWTTNPDSKTYGDADPIPLTTGSGDFLVTDGVTATYSRATGETVTGGPYHITATLSPSGVLSNYIVTNAGADFTINARAATWTTNPNSKTYGDADPIPLTTGSGDFLVADGVTASYSRAPGETVTDSPYHITATLSATGDLNNYTITNAGADFNINAKAIRVAAESKTKEYGTSDPPLTFVVQGVGGGLVNGDTQATAFTGALTRAPGEDVAGSPYAITQGTLAPTSNYTLLNFNPGQLTITQAGSTTTIDCSPGSFIYTGSAITPCTATVTRVGDANTTATVTYASNTNVGTATADASYAGDANHTGSTATQVTFAITKRAITVTAVADSKPYDGNNSSGGVPTFSPALVGTDSPSFTQTFDNRNAGTGKTLTPAGLVSDGNSGNNYSYTYTPVMTGTITTGYCFNGFLSPIGGSVETMNGGSFADPLRAFKLGSTIPVKFAIKSWNGTTCGAPLITGIHTLQAVYYSTALDGDTPVDATPTDAVTTGNQFRLTDSEWHFNLSTKGGGFKAGTWLLTATLQDGSVHTVWITVKK
jgi:hypothetical protein